MVNVRFYGSLKQFGSEFRLDCQTTAEIIQALTSQIPKLRQFIQQGLFTVRVGRDYFDNRYLEQGLSHKLKDDATVHFTPVLKGSKRGGLFGAIAGVAIIAGAIALGPLAGIISTNAAWIVGSVGASLLLGGVAQMLTKMPEMKMDTEKEKKQSTAFSNLSNMTAQGKPVPLAYGLIRTGSMIISQGVETFDAETAKLK
ncbi:tail assembly protein [Haemophilus haemolyticus]|uniref:tail assembly protein n=1 Tax=Haemophilus haemolyticus TaxID=726 RepID=UPI00112E6F65|nr:tail assembly protein [Haemophilus haemolyticus]TPH11520.1 tail assembly protein [Haemophilus haemolyticus]